MEYRGTAVFVVFRFEKALYPTRWNGVRQGIFFGMFAGWSSFIIYLNDSMGFIIGSHLESNKHDSRLNINDILIVSN